MGKAGTGVTSVGSPTVRRRELGALLRERRIDAGMSVEQVTERLSCSPSKVSRMETGHRGVSPRDVRDLCELYGVTDPVERERLIALAREGKKQGWWQSFDLSYGTYVGLETEAISIRDFEPGVIPGLLQTASYARALHENAIPRPTAETIDQQIKVRTIRQQILFGSEPTRFMAVLDEAVLHRLVGGPAVMAEQLAYVIDASRRSNIDVRVIPYGAGAHPALDSTFTLLELAGPAPGVVVYVEGLVGQIYLEQPQDVERYKRTFEQLTATAMSPEESVALMAVVGARHREAERPRIDRAG